MRARNLGRSVLRSPTDTPSTVILPRWNGCRRLHNGEVFVFSDRIPNSFDSRYFGPVNRAEIVGVFRPVILSLSHPGDR